MIIKITFFTVFLFSFSSVFADSKIECFDGLRVVARFSNKSIFCDTNQFLPANSQNLQCMNCPDGYVCNQEPQTYYFSETKSSGIDYSKIINSASNVCATNMPIRFYANFKIAERNCSPGYYLPANSVECTKCLNDHYCPGGQLTFNETSPRGIEPCPSSAPHAPAGSAICYPHIMHLSNERPNDIIYLKSTATTSPALNIDMNNDGIADVFANMTTTQTHMTSISEHYLKIMVNGVLYYVCDDTTYNSD